VFWGWVEISGRKYSYKVDGVSRRFEWAEWFPPNFPYSIVEIEDEISRKFKNMAEAFKGQEFTFRSHSE